MSETSNSNSEPRAGHHGSLEPVLCIGSVLWDIIGRSDAIMGVGSDMPGRISRLPGGVALNIAMTLRRFDLQPVLLTAIGQDVEGRDLLAACTNLGLDVSHVHLSDDLPTDRYMAIEAKAGLVAALADAHSLEAAGDKILKPLLDGSFGSETAPYDKVIALDGNLTEPLLTRIAEDPAFSAADLRVAPASPGKVMRLAPLLACPNATLYLNLEEAGSLLGATPTTTPDAAQALVAQGAARVLVTDGAQPTADCSAQGLFIAKPREVQVQRITGAGDTFMAAHIASELRNEPPDQALQAALNAAAAYVSGESA